MLVVQSFVLFLRFYIFPAFFRSFSLFIVVVVFVSFSVFRSLPILHFSSIFILFLISFCCVSCNFTVYEYVQLKEFELGIRRCIVAKTSKKSHFASFHSTLQYFLFAISFSFFSKHFLIFIFSIFSSNSYFHSFICCAVLFTRTHFCFGIRCFFVFCNSR